MACRGNDVFGSVYRSVIKISCSLVCSKMWDCFILHYKTNTFFLTYNLDSYSRFGKVRLRLEEHRRDSTHRVRVPQGLYIPFKKVKKGE